MTGSVRSAAVLRDLAGKVKAELGRRRGGTPLAPDPTGFYRAGDPGEGRRGEVLAVEEVGAPAGASAWRVRYRTADAAGRPVAASMAVAAPQGPAGERPVVVVVHGAIGVAPGCGPSRTGFDAVYAADLLAVGAVVVAPDLTGLGVEGVDHPYLHGTTAGRSILDAARAAGDLPATGAGTAVVLAGHSAGGHGVLWANELATGADGDGLDVRHTVAISPVSDLAAAMELYGGLRGHAAYAVMLAATWSGVEPVETADALTPAAVARLDALRTRRLDGLMGTYHGRAEQWVRGFTSAAWQAALARQSAGGGGRSAVTVVQGTADPVVLNEWCDDLVDRLRGAGCVAELRAYAGADHTSVLDGGPW